MSGTNALTDHQTFATLLQSHPFIHKTRTKNIQNTYLYPNILLQTTQRCIKYHKNIKSNKLRLNCTLLARRMTNLTNLLHQENSYKHQCTAIAFYQKPIKRVIRFYLDNKYISFDQLIYIILACFRTTHAENV